MRCVSLYLCCCCILATVIGQLKPIVENNDEHQYILKVISICDAIGHYKNYIILAEDLVVEKSFIIVPSLQQSVMETFGRTIIVAGPETGSLKHFDIGVSLAVVLFRGMQDPVLNAALHTLKEQKIISVLFVYMSNENYPPTTEIIEEFFKCCTKNKLYNALLIFKRNNDYEIWKYALESTLSIHRVTERLLKIYTKRKYGLLDKHQLSVAVFQNTPYAFVYNSTDHYDITGSNVSLGGQTGIMLAEFIRFANGTMKILQAANEDYCLDSAQCRTGDKNIEISANVVSNTSWDQYSPLMIPTRYCLVVPYKRQVPIWDYLFYAMGKWKFILFFAFYYSANVLFKRLVNPRTPLDQLLWEPFMISAASPVTNRVVNGMGLPEKFIMICSHMYMVMMISISGGIIATGITTGFHMPDIVGVDSFEANDIHIMASVSQVEEVIQIGALSQVFADRMIFVDQHVLDHHLNSLNDSYVYIIDRYNWIGYEFMQERLRQPKLKLAHERLCGVERILKLPVHRSIPYSFLMEQFFTQARETGLNEKWRQIGFQQLKTANLIRQFPYDPPIQEPLPLEFFYFGFLMYVFGLSLSLIAMLIEFLIGYWRNRRNNRNTVVIL